MQMLVSESRTREWLEKAGWKYSLKDLESHSPEACTKYKELAQKLLRLFPEDFPKTIDWTKIQQFKQKLDELILDY